MTDIQDPGATPEALSIKQIGVIGAGQMGSGIAHVAATTGINVVLNDIGEEQLDKAIATIDKNLERQVSREKISPADKQDALDRLTTSTDHAALGDCDVVIEAATEDEAIKREIYKAVIPSLRSDAIIASNTSSISITPGCNHGPAREIYRHSFHEPGSGDGAGRTDPRHRHR